MALMAIPAVATAQVSTTTSAAFSGAMSERPMPQPSVLASARPILPKTTAMIRSNSQPVPGTTGSKVVRERTTLASPAASIVCSDR
ncbi:hypothetical protein [Geodermatophilus amargosae]|uniref:hypothetical protein n=1 Tax=Geodermatophilus amargosae TaxID=1296565 RepID=UPI0015878AC5|nr:hypothetical protein [Geodermatophilus amargosae]